MKKTTRFLLRLLYICLFTVAGTSIMSAQCPTTTLTNQSFCDADSPTVSMLQASANGGTITWYTSATSSTSFGPNTLLVNGQTYWLGTPGNACTRQAVTVSILGPPMGNPFQGVCESLAGTSTISSLIAIGNNVRWYDAMSGGNLLDPTHLITGGTIYYASQTNPVTGCETTRLAVYASTHVVPVPTGNPLQKFCNEPGNPPRVSDLQPNGSGFRWFATEGTSIPLAANTLLVDGENYFVTTFDPPCESSTRLEVIVEIVPGNNAGENAALSFCLNTLQSNSPLNLFTALGGNPMNTGTWSGPIATANAHLGSLDLTQLTVEGSPYVFTYTVNSQLGCPQKTSQVSISVLPLPIVSISSNKNICSGEEGTVIFTGTPGATIGYNVNGGPTRTIVIGTNGTVELTDVYTSTTTINLVSATQSGTEVCTIQASGSVVIEVTPLPTASISTDISVCQNEIGVVTFTGTPNATVSYTVNGVLQTIVLDGNGVAVISQNFTQDTVYNLVEVSTSVAPICTRPIHGTATVSVVLPPTVTIASSETVCMGGSATITFTGTPLATVVFTENGFTQQLQLNAAGTATITRNFLQTTTYELVSVETAGTTSCIQPVSGTVIITVLPEPVAAVVENQTVCEGQPALVEFYGTPNATVRYIVNGGALQSIVLDGEGHAQMSNVYTSDTTITLIDVTTNATPSCSAFVDQEILIQIAPVPTVTITENQSICAGDTATVNFHGTPNATINFTVNGQAETIVLNAAGTAVWTSILNATTTVSLVSATSAGEPSCTIPVVDSVVITVIPPPTVSIASSQIICSGQSADVTFTGTPLATVSYTINGGPVQTIVLNAAGTAVLTNTYTTNTTIEIVSISAENAVCIIPVSGSVTIELIELPLATIASEQTICENESATINFTGTPNAVIEYLVNGVLQTIVLDGSGVAELTQVYTETTTYTLQSVSMPGVVNCSRPLSQSITINVIVLPDATIANNQQICPGESAVVTITGTPNAEVTYTIGNGPIQTANLGNSGTFEISGTYTETTVITLIDITADGLKACTKPLGLTVTITVVPLPVVSIQSNQTICPEEQAIITFTGTPNSTVTYTLNGSSHTIVLDDQGQAQISNTYTATTVFALVNISMNDAPFCTQPVSGTATIEIQQPPVVTISGGASICPNEEAIVTFNGTPGALVNFTVNGVAQTITLNEDGTFVLIGTYSVDTTIELVSATSAATPGCTIPVAGSVIIKVIPPPVASISADATVCSGESATVTISGTPGAIVTYTNGNSVAQQITIPASGSFQITMNFTQTTVFQLQEIQLEGTGNCVQPIQGQVTITVVEKPVVAMTLLSEATICEGQTAQIQFQGTAGAIVTYIINSGAAQTVILDENGLAVITPTLTENTTITLVNVGLQNVSNCERNIGTSLQIQVIPMPNTGVENTSIVLCNTDTPTDLFTLLGPDAQTGGTWSPLLSSGTGVFNPAIDVAGTYTYQIQGNSICPTASSTVSVGIEIAPIAGENASTEICSNQDPVNLFELLGPTAQTGGTWTPTLSGGNIFNPSVDAAGNYVYTITGSTVCGNASATVSVTIIPGPNAGENGTLVLCTDSEPRDLFLALQGNPQVGGTWSPALSSGSGVFNPAVDAAGDYTYTFLGNDPCDHDQATVSVTVNPVPNAGEDAGKIICSNQDPVDLFTLLNGTPQQGGTWSPALASGNGIFDPTVDVSGSYIYTVGGEFCDTASATVIITVQDSPNAGQDGHIDVCVNATSVNLIDGLSGTFDNGTWSDPNNTGALQGNTVNPSVLGVGSFNFIHTVTGGASPCENDTATVTINVFQSPNAGTFTGQQSVCQNPRTFDLTTLLNGQDAGGVWTNASGNTVNNLVDVTTLTAGLQTFTYTVTNPCGEDQEEVRLQINPLPVMNASNISVASPICAGSAATISVSGMIDGNYTITYDLEGANVSTAHSATLVVQGGTGTVVIPANQIPNEGISGVVIHTIQNTDTQCQSILNMVRANFTVIPVPTFAGATLTATSVCLGNDVQISISGATDIANGTYIFGYALSGATNINGTSGTTTISGGSGNFVIPSALITQAGNYTITLNSIDNGASCVSNSTTLIGNFEVYPIPNLANAAMIVGDACIGNDAEVIISDVQGIADGNYDVTYTLTGAAIGTFTTTVAFVGGDGSFMIPSTELLALGNVVVTIDNMVYPGSTCANAGSFDLSAPFDVVQVNTPTLVDNGNQFCERDNPTIANLSANLNGQPQVLWYSTPTGGTPLSAQDLLVHNTTYFAAGVHASGCESNVRLAVTVDLTHCNEILIPDGFSPNGDTINDTFVIVNLDTLYPNFKLEIYNRYGNIVYKGSIQTPNWDGTSNQGGLKLGDGVLPNGVYFYILEFNDGERKPIQGRVYLNR